MTKLQTTILLADALETLNGLKYQLETIKEALDQTIDWDALEGTECHPDR